MLASETYSAMYDPDTRVMCDMCFKTFSRKSDLRYHIFSHYPEEYLSCESCQETCKSWKLLKKHLQNCVFIKKNDRNSDIITKPLRTPVGRPPNPTPRMSKEFLCHICCRTFKTPVSLKHHINVHNEISYECDLCKKTFLSKHGLQKHVYSHFPEEYLTCKGCQKNCETNPLYKKHIENCVVFKEKKANRLKKNLFECDICLKKFFTKRGLRDHLFSHFPEEYLTCKGCWETFKTVTVFKRHKRECENFKIKKQISLNRKTFKCDLCERTLFTKKGTREHIYAHFPKEYLTCVVCKASFETLKTFKNHVRHCGEPEIKKEFFGKKNALTCDLCKKILLSKDGLRAHIYSHFPEEYCTCRGCGTTCKNMWSYKRHVRDCSVLNKRKIRNLSKKILICDLCGKKYCRKYGIRRHMFAHFPEEYLTCGGCKKFCRNVKGLILHLRDCGASKKKKKCDLNKNGLKCELCERKFFSKDGIRKHMFSHFPEEYCTCRGCKATFHTPWFLQKHERYCEKVWKKKCPICLKVFWEYSKSKLKSHMDWHANKKRRKANNLFENKFSVVTPSIPAPVQPDNVVHQSVYAPREKLNDYSEFDFDDKNSIKCFISEVEIKEEVF